ncbi:hypothetical protein HY025_06020 [Candidatus Daviesbacteria bacterium]|nr:hypothetical protein [Candidatus Daviesbacteria bacterium]
MTAEFEPNGLLFTEVEPAPALVNGFRHYQNIEGGDPITEAARPLVLLVQKRPVQRQAEDDDELLTPLALYLNEISRIPLLTAREEIKLAQDLERGVTAKKELVDPNLQANQRTTSYKNEVWFKWQTRNDFKRSW